MLRFVNAKINIGLQVVQRREDGYHDLQTLFYPIGLYAGTPANPTSFCDILEITPGDHGNQITLKLSGNLVDCPLEKNLVYRAARLYFDRFMPNEAAKPSVCIRLEKHIPDGAGIGGGSADAAFCLMMLNESCGLATDAQLAEAALSLGADCPFFLLNRPVYGEGVGERLQPVALDLSGKWLLLVKPNLHISTKEAFAGITPRPAGFDLRRLPELPIADWKEVVHNDFEDSIFPGHPELPQIKQTLYSAGAEYASLTGSGSCLYGIFADQQLAADAETLFQNLPTILNTYLLKL